MRGGFAFDVQAVCAGFVFALAQADALIQRRHLAAGDGDRRRDLHPHPRLHRPRHLRALRRRRRRADPRGGRGSRHAPADRGILATDLHSDGRYRDLLYVDGGPSATGTAGVVRMAGQEVFKHAVVKLAETGAAALGRAGPRHRRHRLAGAAPGEPPDHDDDRPQARRADGARGRHRAGPRQHLGRLDSARALGRPRRRAHPARATCC